MKIFVFSDNARCHPLFYYRVPEVGGEYIKKQFGDFCHVRLSATTKISRCLKFILGRVPGNKTKIFKIRLSPFGMAEATRLFLKSKEVRTTQIAVFTNAKTAICFGGKYFLKKLFLAIDTLKVFMVFLAQ